MPLSEDFWVLFVANLPIVIALFVALQKRWIVTGVSYNSEMESRNKEVAYREELRQEVLLDRRMLEERDKEKTEALRELTEVVKQTLALNDRLLNEALDQRWDGNSERRKTQDSSRTRRGP